MSYAAKILADSISPNGHRLTSFEITFPRIVLAEFNTHRVFSRNSASSRAIPVEKMLKRVVDDPFVPIWAGQEKGMQAEQELTEQEQANARFSWLTAAGRAMDWARTMLDYGIHKQITNRLLEPFMWHTVIVTATEWSNYFNLRDNPKAQPEKSSASPSMMNELYKASSPRSVNYDEWHTPLVPPDEAFDFAVLDDADTGVPRAAS